MDYCDPCLLLETHVKAKFQCTNCEEKYCDQCKEDHIKFGSFRNHIVRVMEEKQVYDYAYTDSLQRTTSVLNDVPIQKGSTRDTGMSTLQTDSSLTSRRTSGFVVVGQGRAQIQSVKQKKTAAVYDNASISGTLLSSPTRLSKRQNSNKSTKSVFVAVGEEFQTPSVTHQRNSLYDNASVPSRGLSQTSSVSSGFVFVGTRPCHTPNYDIRTIEESILRSNLLHGHAKQENKSNYNMSTNGEFSVFKDAIACSYSQATHRNDKILSSVSEMDKNRLKLPIVMSDVNCTKSSEQADTAGLNITSSSSHSNISKDAVINEFVMNIVGNEFSSRIGIHGQRLLMKITSKGILFYPTSSGSSAVFECPYGLVRSYNIAGNVVMIQIGRKCKFGEGALMMKHTHEDKFIKTALIQAMQCSGHGLSFV